MVSLFNSDTTHQKGPYQDWQGPHFTTVFDYLKVALQRTVTNYTTDVCGGKLLLSWLPCGILTLAVAGAASARNLRSQWKPNG